MLLDLEKPRRRQPISLTPLIDVVFILLLFFMLTSSFMQWRQVDLPEPTQAEGSDAEIRVVHLAADGVSVTIGEQSIDSSNQAALAQAISAAGNVVFALDVEKGATTQSLITLVDRLKQAGAKQVSLAGVLP